MSKKIVILLLSGYFTTFALAAAAYGLWWYSFDRAPVQPIDFSHKVHVNQAGLSCDYCHKYAEKGKMPGVPAVSVCMDCHKNVKTETEEIQKLTKEYWEAGKPVPWLKVHYFAPRKNIQFTHKRHILSDAEPFAGKELEDKCAVCHGEVRGMDRIHRVRSLKMGWCVSCHQANDASIDCWTCHG